MPQTITYESIVDPQINPTIEHYQFLFQWSGSLVRGANVATATRSPETIPQARLSDWKNKLSVFAPVEDRTIKPKPAPDVIPDILRDRANLDRPSIAPDTNPTSIARPTAAAMFDQRQNEARYQTDNPVLNELNLSLFRRNFYAVPDVSDNPYFAGVAWALGQITIEVMGFPLIAPDRVAKLRYAAIDIVYGHLPHHKPIEHVEAVLDQFQSRSIEPLAQNVANKLKRIAQEQYRFCDRALIPVLDVDGTVLRSLTLCNIATAFVAIGLLDKSAIDAHSFFCGAQDAVLRLQSLGQQFAPA